MTDGDSAVTLYETDEEGDEMPLIGYMLVVLLGSGAAIPGETAGGPSPRTFTAHAVTQPSGGTEGMLGQATGGSPGKQAGPGKKGGRVHTAARHHRRGRRHTKEAETGKKPIKQS